MKFWQEGGSRIVIILKYHSSKAVLDTVKFIDTATTSSNKYRVGEVKVGLR